MARNKHPSFKQKLQKFGTQHKWAPFWTVLKIYGKGKRVHPSRHTAVKRHWRRNNLKI